MRIIRAAEFREGRWKNGFGVSWDIASDPEGADMDKFYWRFAIARIDADVPFSNYTGVDRIFTLIEGRGLSLDIAGLGRLNVIDRLAPHRFPGDAATSCKLTDGPCKALNLFLARGTCRADVAVSSGESTLHHPGPVLVFALEGPVTCNGEELAAGDASVAAGEVRIGSGTNRHYRALLHTR